MSPYSQQSRNDVADIPGGVGRVGGLVGEERLVDISPLGVSLNGQPLNRMSEGLWAASEACFTSSSGMSLDQLGRSLRRQVRLAVPAGGHDGGAAFRITTSLGAVANTLGGYTLVLSPTYGPDKTPCPFIASPGSDR